MKARFEGPSGKTLLINVLKQQRIVECEDAMAELLAEKGELIEFGPGEVLITQGGFDTDIYFIIVGEAAVYVNQRYVADRGRRDLVGEMALIDPTAVRMATVTARNMMVVLKVDQATFFDALNQFPRAWRAIAFLVMDRLREAEQIHRAPNPEPVLFLGCAVEDLAIAQQVQLNLKHSHTVVHIWTDDVFGPSGVAIDDLLAKVDHSDFAAFVFGANDLLTSRKEHREVPRDNVVFELGLFMGRLGRNRTYIIKEDKSEIKIPTDLLGLTPITYVGDPSTDPVTVLAPVCTELKRMVEKVGVR